MQQGFSTGLTKVVACCIPEAPLLHFWSPFAAVLRAELRVLRAEIFGGNPMPRIGRISKVFAPHYGYCYRCKTAWKFANGHKTSYSPKRACFPLCERCWGELTTEKRLPYYRVLWEAWGDGTTAEEWELIRKAVLDGR